MKITIEGPRGCGKTKLAHAIVGLLRLMGFNHTQVFEGDISPAVAEKIISRAPTDSIIQIKQITLQFGPK